jgi:hypothetical protein
MKMMHGACAFAWAKRSRTRAAPTPTNISTNSAPEMLKKVTPASPATARASSVFPVPGGPTRSTPLGILAPSFPNFSGVLRNSTISSSSTLASSTPATSPKVTPVPSSPTMRALLFPTVSTPCPGFMRRSMKIQKATMRRNGRTQISMVPQRASCIPVQSTPCASRSGTSVSSGRTQRVTHRSGTPSISAIESAGTASIRVSPTRTSFTCPAAMRSRISL